MRPGVDVISRALPLPRSAPTDTGACFMLGATTSGPDFALVRSLTEYEAIFGTRTGSEAAYDAAEAYFREGGYKLTVSRTNAPTAPLAAVSDTLPEVPEDLSSLSRAELDELARELGIPSPQELPNKEAVIIAINSTAATERTVLAGQSEYEIALQAADVGIAAALARLGADLGPGQVFIADPTLAAVKDNQVAVLAHGEQCNRVGLLSLADDDAATLITAATALQADVNARYGAIFCPSATIPGIAGGTTRTVPYTAVQAGIIARNDAVVSPNVPSAGIRGQASYALDLANRYTDLEYQNLNAAGVNMARLIYGGVRTYGYRSIVDDSTAASVWLSFGWSRLNMQIVALAEAVGENYVFSQIDGQGKTIASFAGDLRAMLVPLYEGGSLYGTTADEAFDVNVGSAVNTPASIAAGELRAVIMVRMSPFSEWVVIEIVKVATTQALAA